MAKTGYYLLDNQQATPQYARKRRNNARVSGVIDVHTWESAPDWIGPDTGLENAIPYLLKRLDPGSYHSANDSDSTRRLLPWWMEAWHDRHTNNHAIGVSIATQAHKWSQAPKAWRDAAVRRAAQEAARIADEVYLSKDLSRVARLGIDVPAKWLTQAEAHARTPGFVRHGTSDPGRRSDPWPANAPEADLFLEHYKAARKTGRYAKHALEDEVNDADRKSIVDGVVKAMRPIVSKAAETAADGAVYDLLARTHSREKRTNFHGLNVETFWGVERLEQAVAKVLQGQAADKGVDPATLAKDVAALLTGEVREALREAAAEVPHLTSEEHADLVVGKIADRLNRTLEG